MVQTESGAKAWATSKDATIVGPNAELEKGKQMLFWTLGAIFSILVLDSKIGLFVCGIMSLVAAFKTRITRTDTKVAQTILAFLLTSALMKILALAELSGWGFAIWVLITVFIWRRP